MSDIIKLLYAERKDINTDKKILKKYRYELNSYKRRDNKIEKTIMSNKKYITYFILAPNGLVKIGKTSNLKARLKAADCMYPHIKLIGVIQTPEKTVHNIFSDFRIDKNKEWFKYDTSMMDYIKIQQDIHPIENWGE